MLGISGAVMSLYEQDIYLLFTCLKFGDIFCLCLLVGVFFTHDWHLAVGLVPVSGTTRVQSSHRAGWGPRDVGCRMPPHSCCHDTWATFGALVLAVFQAKIDS